MPQISVIVPVFNKKVNQVKRCLKSLTTINISNEILLVDDGSELELGNEYKNIAKKYNAKYIYKKNGGVGSARNLGIEQSKGKYITFVDADDEFIGSNIQESSFSKNQDVIFYNVKRIIGKAKKEEIIELGVRPGEVKKDDLYNYAFTEGLISWSVAKFYSKHFLMSNSIFFDQKMKLSEDFDFVIRVLSANPKVFYCNAPIYVYYYSTSTGQEREEKYPLTVLNDLSHSYEIQISILRNINLKSERKRKITTSLKKNVIKNISRIYANFLRADPIKARDNIDKFVKLSKKITKEENFDLATNFRIYIIEHKKYSLIYGYYYLKKFYHYLKKDPLN